jgi:hypothetical protein
LASFWLRYIGEAAAADEVVSPPIEGDRMFRVWPTHQR